MDKNQYIIPDEAVFSLSGNGLLSLTLKGEEHKRVQLVRLFPFLEPEGYLSVLNGEEELGIIEKVNDFPEEQQKVIRDYLRGRYFIPRVEKIKKVEEKLGYVYMDLETVLGPKTICIADVTANIRQIREDYIAIIDVQGNRYYIDNLNALSRDTRQKIEMYI